MLKHALDESYERLILSFGWVFERKCVLGWERLEGGKNKIFEKLSLFAFKNCENALFASKLLTKLLVKMPLKHSSVFTSSYFPQNSRETLCLNFSVFWFLPSSFLQDKLTHDLLVKTLLKEFFFFFFDKNKK